MSDLNLECVPSEPAALDRARTERAEAERGRAGAPGRDGVQVCARSRVVGVESRSLTKETVAVSEADTAAGDTGGACVDSSAAAAAAASATAKVACARRLVPVFRKATVDRRRMMAGCFSDDAGSENVVFNADFGSLKSGDAAFGLSTFVGVGGANETMVDRR